MAGETMETTIKEGGRGSLGTPARRMEVCHVLVFCSVTSDNKLRGLKQRSSERFCGSGAWGTRGWVLCSGSLQW